MKGDRKSIIENSKSLQKFTESENKINSILSLKKITNDDLEILTKSEYLKLFEVLTKKMNELKGEDMDEFIEKIVEVMSSESKNQIWEYNHNLIISEIHAFINTYERMPSKTELANKTQLSRQTVHKHLKDYKSSPYYTEFQEQFTFMQSQVMATILRYAVNGDMKAAKLYLEGIGVLKNPSSANNSNPVHNNTLIQNQNNYIQIGGTVLNQKLIQNLNPEQISTIEGILKTIVIKDDSR
ncbi:hypothetical protein SAMN05880574_1478 [Chryseobacterium sp. RU37D]|uniref:hypothetical protein n=1 Tax=Chryseobacterium sp. RU37D TaxID=1907397 RepID=UPI00095653CF|nr:hypothetical protein [Chryseobacterium sp. RU37D]SIQ99890.1 hypothetical protein SAMN05880574_1478 [Chryseobacterium sp. RU37D]